MRIGIYARVSTQRQAQADGPPHQLDRLHAHALHQGWTVRAEPVFRDDGYSDASLKRPGLERLRDRAALRELDRILITAPDRLARNSVHQVLLLEEIIATGCAVEFLEQPMSQDPHDQLLLQIRGAVAEYERSLIAERMYRGRCRKLQAGVLLPWTKLPYGYRLDPDRPRDPAGVRLDAARAAVVSEMFACSEPAIRPPQQHRSPLSSARSGQLWRVWASCLGRCLPSGYRYYCCRGKLPALQSHRKTKCPARYIPAEQVDALVWKDLVQRG
jgi:DNA invertase Pin-like site-specific DNA recombinase